MPHTLEAQWAGVAIMALGMAVAMLGAGASGDELERRRDVEGRTRTDPDGAVPKYSTSDLHRDSGRRFWGVRS